MNIIEIANIVKEKASSYNNLAPAVEKLSRFMEQIPHTYSREDVESMSNILLGLVGLIAAVKSRKALFAAAVLVSLIMYAKKKAMTAIDAREMIEVTDVTPKKK